MIRNILIYTIGITFSCQVSAKNIEELRDDASTAESLTDFMKEFEVSRQARISTSREISAKRIINLNRELETQETKQKQTEKEALADSIDQYRRSLSKFPDNPSRPATLISLSQNLLVLADYQSKESPSEAKQLIEEAIQYIDIIVQEYPASPQRQEALYLGAGAYESMGEVKKALPFWRTLSEEPSKESTFTIMANLRLGDISFQDGDFSRSDRFYNQAQTQTKNLNIETRFEQDINYRKMWTAYRSANAAELLKYSGLILSSSGTYKELSKSNAIIQDAIELSSDTLHQLIGFAGMKRFLENDGLHENASAIGLKTMDKLALNNSTSTALKLGMFLIEKFPLAKEYPEVLLNMMNLHRINNQPKAVARYAEKFALIVPKSSLWRSKNSQSSSHQALDKYAIPATVLAANFHYERGLSTGNKAAFRAAKNFYTILIEEKPKDNDIQKWRLRAANCLYFSDQTAKAAEEYDKLIEVFQTDGKELELAFYQSVKSRERIWREKYRVLIDNEEPNSKSLQKELDQLDHAIELYSRKYPNQTSTKDLFLLGAAAHRDSENFLKASKYWQRTLVGDVTPRQKATAIRGLVLANIKNGSFREVLDISEKFVRLENWNESNQALLNELLGVLSQSTLDEGGRLYKNGDVIKAGKLLYDISKDFANIPFRSRIFRDGAYMLAIGGEWGLAQNISQEYLATNLKPHRADMIYLLARAHEFQLQFSQAAASYLELYQSFPKHPRAAAGLQRAKNLALADDQYHLAAESLERQASDQTNKSQRRAFLKEASLLYLKSGQANKAEAIARKLTQESTSNIDRLEANLVQATIYSQTDRQPQARRIWQSVVTKTKATPLSSKSLIQKEVTSKANYEMGKLTLASFNQIGLTDNLESPKKAIDNKVSLFESLVEFLDRSAAMQLPKYAPEARYLIAKAADDLSEEIAGLPIRRGESIDRASDTHLSQIITRLKNISKKYYSNNVLELKKDPGSYNGNEWIYKSQMRLRGYALPGSISIQTEIPYSLGQSNLVRWR